jgi:hypothetical protein
MLGKLLSQQLLLDSCPLRLLHRLDKLSLYYNHPSQTLHTRGHLLVVVRREEVKSLFVGGFDEFTIDVETILDVCWDCVGHVGLTCNVEACAFQHKSA